MATEYRLRFTKLNKMKYIGHLDLLRLFQKAINRAEIPISYSAGFNPHQIISIAMPLPIGMESLGEYADISLENKLPSEELISRLNAQMPEGIKITKLKELSPNEQSGAAIVQAADYEIKATEPIDRNRLEQLLEQTEIIMQKRTKSGVKQADIRPDIHTASEDGDTLSVRIATGSAGNLKPQLLMEYLYGALPYDPLAIRYLRKDLLTKTNGGFVGLI